MNGLPIGLMLRLGDFGELDCLRELVLGLDGSLGALVLEEGPDSELDPVVTLAHLAQLRDFVAFGFMVDAENGRPPSVMAKLLSGLDLTTDGRAFMMSGCLDDGVPQDYDRTEDALVLINAMTANDATTYQGTYYAVNDAWNTPRQSNPVPGFAKAAHAMTLTEVFDRSKANAALPSALVVEIGEATLDDHVALAALFHDDPGIMSRVGVITVGPSTIDLAVPPQGEQSVFDALLFRFGSHPQERQLFAFADLLGSS